MNKMDKSAFFRQINILLVSYGSADPAKYRLGSNNLLQNLFEFEYTPREKINSIQSEKVHVFFL